MPEHHADEDNGDWHMERYKELVHSVTERGDRVHTKETQGNKRRDTYDLSVPNT